MIEMPFMISITVLSNYIFVMNSYYQKERKTSVHDQVLTISFVLYLAQVNYVYIIR